MSPSKRASSASRPTARTTSASKAAAPAIPQCRRADQWPSRCGSSSTASRVTTRQVTVPPREAEARTADSSRNSASPQSAPMGRAPPGLREAPRAEAVAWRKSRMASGTVMVM
ncbi:MAG: hypothetical protein IPH15_14455 [Comamonadaceae bacterium]|nr:hypothetical protein [Comamonadaceae bacterium]